MATVGKSVRVYNPGVVSRVKKKLSPLQKLFFGSKRQRSSVRNPRSRMRLKKGGATLHANRKMRKAMKHGNVRVAELRSAARQRRLPNVGQILTIIPNGVGSKKRVTRKVNKMAIRRKRNYGTTVGRSWSHLSTKKRKRNPRRRRSMRHSNPKVIVRYRNRSMRRKNGYRRNPDFTTGTKVFGVIGGAAITGFACKMLPVGLTTGILGYLTTAAVAVAQGKLVGKVFRKPQLGEDMIVGGLTFLAIKALNDMLPSFASSLPFGLNGMGLLTSSSFYTPQIPIPGSMTNFIRPNAVPMMVAQSTGMKGLYGESNNRISQRRVGRTA